METIIVTTDFTASSANALDYACAFARANNYCIHLLHIYTIPVTYTSDGLSLASLNDALDNSRERLREEQQRVAEQFPGLTITAEMMVGSYLETLQKVVNTSQPAMVIMGAAAAYSDLWLLEEDWLATLTAVSCPVLVIPAGLVYKPVRHIAFACDYKKSCMPQQAAFIQKLVQITGAALHVVHVVADSSAAADAGRQDVQESLSGLHPQYHAIADKRIIKSISDFTVQHKIDMLVVIPHRHGFWYRLFNKSYTRQLAQLNHLPVMAIHEI